MPRLLMSLPPECDDKLEKRIAAVFNICLNASHTAVTLSFILSEPLGNLSRTLMRLVRAGHIEKHGKVFQLPLVEIDEWRETEGFTS